MTREVLFLGGPMHGKQMAIKTSPVVYMEPKEDFKWWDEDNSLELSYEEKYYMPRKVYIYWTDDYDPNPYAILWWVATPGEWSMDEVEYQITKYLRFVVLMSYLVPNRWPATLVMPTIMKPDKWELAQRERREFLGDINFT